jgi:hypothetical protein
MFVEKDRTFFCSELVVKCWKILGIITNEEACANFLPGALETDDVLKLAEGVKLSNILNIQPSR